MVPQNWKRRNIAEHQTHQIINLINFIFHTVDGGVPHEMVYNVAREVDCINFLNIWDEIASHAVCHNKTQMLPNVAL